MRAYGAGHVNLTFHGVGVPRRPLTRSEEPYWIDPALFLAILDRVDGSVTLTFDDGNISDLEHALPALVERRLHATFFLAVDLLDSPGYLRSDEVRSLVVGGMSIGLHGHGHRPWPALDADELRLELHDARLELERLSGAIIDVAACPFGRYNRKVLERLRKLGFRRVYTSDGGLAVAEAWLQPRNSVRGTSAPDVVEDVRRRCSSRRALAAARLRTTIKRLR